MRRLLVFATLWHVLWGALLVPYAVVVAWVFGGQAAAQTAVEGFAIAALPLTIYLTLALPLNLSIAALTYLLGARIGPVVRLNLGVTIFGVAWFFAIQVFLPIADLNGGFSTNLVAIWAAIAGAAYGLVLALLPEPPAVRVSE